MADQIFRTERAKRVKKAVQKRTKTLYGSATELKLQEKKITMSLLFCFGTACRNKAVMTKTG